MTGPPPPDLPQPPVATAGEGVRDILPAMIAAMPIGLLFGALGVGKGLSVAEAGLMSILVFAGGAQFAALEMWTYPVPVLALAFSTLMINARHVLMGASLAPKIRGFSWTQRLAGAWLLTDESWALAERRALQRQLTPAYWFAVAGMLPAAWIGCTFLGAWLGSFLGDPTRLGADFAFTALFIGLIAGLWKGRATAITVAASAVASALVHVAVGAPWHVVAGAVAGIAAAICTAPSDRRAA
jgi:4-azaleucine resistance transporter AzlC